MTQNVRFHGNGIVECITCGAIYEVTAVRYRTADYGALTCIVCGEQMDDRERTFSPNCLLVAVPTESSSPLKNSA